MGVLVLCMCGGVGVWVCGDALAGPGTGRAVTAEEVAKGYASDHVIVKMRREAVRGALRGRRRRETAGRAIERRLGLPRGARIEEDGFTRWEREDRARRGREAMADEEAWSRHARVSVPEGWTAEAMVEKLKRNPDIEYVEFDGVGTGGILADDPYFWLQWHLSNSAGGGKVRADIHAPEAWDITTGNSNVIVAVLDTGCNTNLADFEGRTVAGYDFINNDDDPADDHVQYGSPAGHGTFACSVLCASGNNGQLVAGVNWQCRLMPVKVLNANNGGLYSQWADGIDWAVEHGADVINLSAGGPSESTTLSNAIVRAIEAGVVFVTITHNTTAYTVMTFPGRMGQVITVGGTAEADERAGFSLTGPTLDLVAPASNIWGILRTGAVVGWRGTSFAGPQVAGVAAMVVGMMPGISHEQVRALLCAGADDQVGKKEEDIEGFDIYHGWGRLNAYNTLLLARSMQGGATAGASDGGKVRLRWNAPPNAMERHPCFIEYTDDVSSGWLRVTQGIVYGTAGAEWTDDGTQTGEPPGQAGRRYYRVGVMDP